MLSSLRKLSSQSSAELIRNIIFFIAFYLYLWLVVETRLIYHGGGIIASFPIFFRGWAFFCEFLSYPGGLVEYISAFLSQFLYIGWAGAIVVTVQAWLICVCSGYFIKAINARRLLFVRFIPPIILLMTYTRYRYFFTTMMALLTALFFVCLYLKVKSKSRLSGVVVFLVMSVVVYTIAGGAHLVFAVLCGVYELFWRRRWRISLVYFLLAVVIPYVEGVLIFNVDIVNAFDNLLPFSWGITYYEPYKEVLIMLYVLYLFLPFTALVSGLWRILFVKQVKTKPHKSKKQKSISNKLAAALVKCCSCAFVKSLVLFAVFGTTAFFFYDSRIKTLFEVDYYSYHKMWPQVLASARGYPQNHPVVHAVNRALYHTDRLGYDMFCWPQYRDALFLTSQEYSDAYWQKIDIMLEIGFINIAEHNLAEAMEMFGAHPSILKRLVLVNMVKGEIGAARIYLGALSKTLFHAGWARHYIDKLESGPNLSTDKDIQHLRSMMMEKDYGHSYFEIRAVLLDLLAKNRQNRMAFEYLMALYLLKGDMEAFIQNLNRLDDFNYPQIPRLYEEAILFYAASTDKEVNMPVNRISPQSRQRFIDFIRIFKLHRENKEAAFDELARNHGDSYFFYSLYGFSKAKK